MNHHQRTINLRKFQQILQEVDVFSNLRSRYFNHENNISLVIIFLTEIIYTLMLSRLGH